MGNAAGVSSTGQVTPSSGRSLSPDRGDSGPWTEGQLDELAHKFEVSKTEVELLWHRFQALGPDAQGCLDRSVFQKPPYSEDIFCRQIWKRFTGCKGAPHKITFQSFAHTMIWWQQAPINLKLELLFSWMRDVDGITPHVLSRILKHVLPNYQENELKQIAEHVVTTMNPTADPPMVKLKEFQLWMGQLPEEKLRDALDFRILHIDAGTRS